LKCNTNKCPTGIATQDATRAKAVNVEEKRHRVASYHQRTVASFLDMLGAMGHSSVDALTPASIKRRVANEREMDYSQLYPSLNAGDLVGKKNRPEIADDWTPASATSI
jgi:hypothetical protein